MDNLKRLKFDLDFKDQQKADYFNLLILHLESLNKQKINEIEDLKTYVYSFCSKYSTENKDNIDLCNILHLLEFKKIKTTIIKSQDVVKFPNLLVIHVQKIFHYDQNNGATMIRGNLDFNEFLTVIENGKLIKYELYSFLQHMGSSEYGHYISFKKYSKDKWVILNDAECINFDWEQIKNTNADPYMLFYRRLNN